MKPIFIAASPNTERDDILLALKLLFSPWKWFDQYPVRAFESEMQAYLENDVKALAVDSARSAFYLILKEYGVGPGDEVLLPSFSCLVIANPIIWLGAKPVYVDVDPATLNIDMDDVKRKKTSRTKAILVQHTFGRVIDMDVLRKVVGNTVKVIEDTAHSLGGSYKDRKVGSVGDAAVATFGIEKVISTVRGGMVLTRDRELAKRVAAQIEKLPRFSIYRVKISLLNPLLWKVLTPVYYLGAGKFTLGRILVAIAHRLGILGNMIEDCEYDTEKPSWLPAKLPGALAELGRNQLRKIDRLNEHRSKIAKVYSEVFEIRDDPGIKVPLRYPVLVSDQKAVLRLARKQRVVLGDWYKSILYAPVEKLEKLNYRPGMTPNAENLSRQIINLPTGINVTEVDAKRISEAIKPFVV